MFGMKQKKLLERGVWLGQAMIMGIVALEYLLGPNYALMARTVPFYLVPLGMAVFTFPFGWSKETLVNRWYRVAYWVAWILCLLFGALLMSAGVTWGIAGAEWVQSIPVLIAVSGLVVLIGLLLVGGLAAIGEIAQGNEETRQFACSLGGNKRKMGDGEEKEHADAGGV